LHRAKERCRKGPSGTNSENTVTNAALGRRPIYNVNPTGVSCHIGTFEYISHILKQDYIDKMKWNKLVNT